MKTTSLFQAACISSLVGLTGCGSDTTTTVANTAPEAKITVPNNVVVGHEVTFDASDSVDPDGTVVRYYWNGMDSAYNVSTYTYKYTETGTQSITLVVEDNQGQKSAVKKVDFNVVADDGTVDTQKPDAKFTGLSTVTVNQSITFNASSSTDNVGVVKYIWNGVEGSSTYKHTFSSIGSEDITLIVVDAAGNRSDDFTQLITVNSEGNKAPQAGISGQDSVEVGRSLTFDASGSTDEDGTIVKYSWNGEEGTSPSYTHEFTSVGKTTITLTVEDDDGAQSTVTLDVTVTPEGQVENQKPVAKISGSAIAEVGEEIIFDAADSTDADGDVTKYFWNGSTTAGDSTLTQTFDAAGTQTVTLIVEDDKGLASDSVSFEVTVSDVADTQAPDVTATPAAGTYTSDQSISLAASDNVDAAADITVYFTTDGTAPTTESPVYSSEKISATDINESGTDLTIKTLAVDTAGNEKTQTFTYTIAEQTTGEYYATNPNGQVGANKTITSLADWSEDMIVAQGVANDAPRSWMGFHEYPDPDLYALYAAWDDNNLYLMVEIPNIDEADTIDNDKSYAGSQFLPMGWALNTGKRTPGTGELLSGDSVWNASKVYSYDNGGIDTLIMHHPRLDVGTPGLFLTDSDGYFSYEKPYCLPFEDEETGVVTVKRDVYFNESVSSKMWAGVNADGSFGGKESIDVDSYTYVDLKADGIKATAYQLTVSFDAIGIDKAYLESNGIGISVFATYGESMMDVLPFDDSKFDNVTVPYSGANDGTSEEKADFDSITAPLAKIGKL